MLDEKPKKTVKKVAKKIMKREVIDIQNHDALKSTIGDPERIEAIEDAITKFCSEQKFEKVFFHRPCRAFRLYRGNNHLDWINLNELSKRYELKLPDLMGSALKYQPPVKRAYR